MAGARTAPTLAGQIRDAARLMETTGQGVFFTDAEQRILHVNPSFCRLTGFAASEVIGRTPTVFASGRHSRDFYEAMWRGIDEDGHWGGEVWDRRKDGEPLALWLNVGAIKNPAGEVCHYLVVFSDITARKETEEELQHRANHDALTGLPNRALFKERLEHALLRAQRYQLNIAVLFLDLDHFKEINDSLGHSAGDTLLIQVAERLNSTVRKVDTVARLAGDEFTLILTDINDFRDAATVAKKILRRFSEPFDLDGRPSKVTISIGISLYPTDGQDVPSLLQQADEAMYTAKKQGRDSFRFASADLSQQAFEREALESALRQAVVDGGLEVHYQPIIEVATGRITGAEALLRWRHPEIGLMVPGQFLPLAQHSGLMPAISQWVLKSAFDQGAAWRAAGHGDLRLCINVSASELKDPNFHGLVERLLQETGLPGSSVDFEIPASVGLEGKEPVIRAMEELHRLGCRIALDDFGTGRPDFASFRRLPVNVLKVSPEYIRDVASGGQEAKLVRAATEIAHSLHIEVVAKAVETTDQYDFLRQNQCDRAQGFFFSRPLPPGEFLKLMAGPALSVAGGRERR